MSAILNGKKSKGKALETITKEALERSLKSPKERSTKRCSHLLTWLKFIGNKGERTDHFRLGKSSELSRMRATMRRKTPERKFKMSSKM